MGNYVGRISSHVYVIVIITLQFHLFLSLPLMGADFFDGFYDSNYYFCFCFSGFQYAFAVSQAMHQIWFIGHSFQGLLYRV